VDDEVDWAGRGFTKKLNVSDSAECPSCAELAEPEQDGDLTYYACSCGYEFGYQHIAEQQDSSCQLGVPEDIRRAAQPAPEASSLPLLQIGRRP
jgi:hypothetical protein